MNFQISIFIIQFIILYNNFKYSKALIGHNVSPVAHNEFPYVICLAQYNPQQNLNHNLLCTGTLISRTLVLTAEHCLQGLDHNVLQVLIGPGELSRSTPYFVIWWISYDQWHVSLGRSINAFYNDVAVIKLSGDLPHITAAPLVRISTTFMFDLEVTVIGCGKSNTGMIAASLQKVTLTVLKNSECSEMVSNLGQEQIPIPENFMCTFGVPYSFLEEGDSGGPAIYFGDLAGISVGVCPKLEGEFHSMKVNIHTTIEYSFNFINHMLNIP